MNRPDGQTSIWTQTGVFVRRSRSTFCHVSWSVFEGVTKCQNWLGERSSGAAFSLPATSGQLACGTMPSEATKGANQQFVAMRPSASRTSGSTLPKENTRNLSTSFVPSRNAQSSNAR